MLMKVEGNEAKLVKGRKYWVSDHSDEMAILYKNKNEISCLYIWNGEMFENSYSPCRWNYAIPFVEHEYITAEFSEPYPEWWTGKPILGQVKKLVGWSVNYIYCIGYIPGAHCPYIIADGTDARNPENARFEGWNKLTTPYMYFKPYIKPDKVAMTFSELCKRAGLDPDKVEIHG
jgi:hypothetical protein